MKVSKDSIGTPLNIGDYFIAAHHSYTFLGKVGPESSCAVVQVMSYYIRAYRPRWQYYSLIKIDTIPATLIPFKDALDFHKWKVNKKKRVAITLEEN